MVGEVPPCHAAAYLNSLHAIREPIPCTLIEKSTWFFPFASFVLQGECHSQPVICSMIYRPVCGCNGKEYANDCEAANAGVSVRNYGSCGPEKRE